MTKLKKIEKLDLLVTKIGIAYPCHDRVLKRAILLNEPKEFKTFVTAVIFVAALKYVVKQRLKFAEIIIIFPAVQCDVFPALLTTT